MKALVLHGISDLRYEEVSTPKIKEDEVLVKIKACGICGSDIPRVFTKGTYHFPTIPGHEFSGQVVEVGECVSKNWLGKRAAVFPMLPCLKCDACQVGQYAQCKDYNYYGSRCDGGFAEYLAVKPWNLVEVPDSLSYEEAAMAEPAAVAIHALSQVGIDMGDSVAIFGAGPIGLMLGQWAKAWGADKVLLVDIDEEKVEFAKEQGFKNVWNSMKGDAVNWIKEVTGGRGADVAVEGAGVSVTFEQVLTSARNFGKVVLMGNPAGDMKLSQKGYWEILRKQLIIRGTWNSGYAELPKNDWKLTIRAMETGKLNVKPFITHRVGLEKGIEAFELIRDKKEFTNKVMIVMDK
jgi:L-iditol 2-dehydrogenase